MKYYKENKATGERREISFEEAKEQISMYYKETVCSYEEMLSLVGTIPTPRYDVIIEK